MPIDWVSTLEEQAEFARQVADDVMQTLSNPDLSVAQAARLYHVVEQGAQTFDRILEEMEQHDDVEADLIKSAEAIADIWTNLSVSTANKLRALQGLEPIEFPPDETQ
jgi:chemotaxis regulatin CheY-phosphate phosphatase CheZ